MPSSSPYQNNDYQSASTFRPYSLGVNDIFKAISAQDAFWKQGAQRVMAAHDQALDLDLTLEENRKIRDDYMKKAEEEMRKLSSSDLSNGDVQRQGIGLFKNLLNDRAILIDDQLTKKQKTIFSDAQRYMKDEKTKGAGFHTDNLNYALRNFEGFGANASRADLDRIHEKAKNSQYIPFYDVSKERMDILKNCKPNKVSGTTTQGMYLETETENSLSEQKLFGCLEGGMSEQARQQIMISGVSRYGNNYQALKEDYIDAATTKKRAYSDQLASLQARKVALEKQQGNEEEVEQLKGQIKQYEDGIGSLDKELNGYDVDGGKVLGYHQWNDEYIKKNYDRLATDAYFKKSNGAFAQAFAFRDIENDRKANPVAITMYTQQQQNARMVAGWEHDMVMEEEKSQNDLRQALLTGKTKDGKDLSIEAILKGNPAALQTFPTSAIEEVKKTTEGAVRGKIAEFDAQEQKAARILIQNMAQTGALPDVIRTLGISPEGNISGEQYKQFWRKANEYIATASNNDPIKQEIIEAKNAITVLRNSKTNLEQQLIQATEDVKSANSNLFIDGEREEQAVFSRLKPVKIGKETIAPERMKNILQGRDSQFTAEVISAPAGGMGGYGGSSATEEGVIRDRASGKIVGRSADVNNYKRVIENSKTNFKGKLNTYLSSNVALQRMALVTGNLATEANPTVTKFIEETFGQSLGQISDAIGDGKVVFNVTNLDPSTGKVRLTAIKNKDEKVSSEELMSAIAKKGKGAAPGNKMYAIVDDTTIELTVPGMQLVQAPTYAGIIDSNLDFQEKRLNSLPAQGTTTDIGTDPSGIVYQIKTSRSVSGGVKYTLLANGQPTISSGKRADIIKYSSDALQGVNFK